MLHISPSKSKTPVSPVDSFMTIHQESLNNQNVASVYIRLPLVSLEKITDSSPLRTYYFSRFGPSRINTELLSREGTQIFPIKSISSIKGPDSSYFGRFYPFQTSEEMQNILGWINYHYSQYKVS